MFDLGVGPKCLPALGGQRVTEIDAHGGLGALCQQVVGLAHVRRLRLAQLRALGTPAPRGGGVHAAMKSAVGKVMWWMRRRFP